MLRKFLSSLMMLASLSLVFMVPAFAETSPSKMNASTPPMSGQTGINKTYYPSTVTGTTTPNGTTNGYYNNRLNSSQTGTGLGIGNGTPNNIYGTNGTYGAYDSTRMNYRPYNTTNVNHMTARAKNNVRALETTTRRTFDWGWLGLLGLFGLAGMRSRSRNEIR